jgi:tetratricopeptide (TPR) repeat protein
VNGVVVSDRVAYQLGELDDRPSSDLTSPPETWNWLAPERVAEEDIDYGAISQIVHLSQDDFEEAISAGEGYEDPIIHLRRLLASTHTYHRMTLATLREVQPDVMLTYFEGTDTIAHLFAPFAPPLRPHINRDDFARYSDAVGKFYELADDLLGELLEIVGPNANVILCSDHGFAWGKDRPRDPSGVNTPTAAWWHRDPGILVLAGPAIRHLGVRQDAHVLDLAPTFLALSGLPPGNQMPGTVLRWALSDDSASVDLEGVDYVELLDWKQPGQEWVRASSDDIMVEKLRALGYLVGPEVSMDGGAARPESARSLLNLGTVLLEQDRPEEALAAYQRALELDPEAPGAWIKCAVAQHRLGLYEDALASNRRGLELGGSDAHRESASVGMAAALVSLERPSEALLLLEAATAHMPDSSILWKTRGEIALGLDRYESARLAYTRVLEIEEDTDAYNRLAALVLELDGDLAGAQEMWRRSLQMNPDQPRVRDALDALGSRGR